MKKSRILIALLMVTLLTVGMPLSAFAAVHDVTSAEEVQNVFATDTDAEVTLNMQNDIYMGAATLSGGEGQTYTFNGNGNSLNDVTFDSGEIIVNADMDGLTVVEGDANVSVEGDMGYTVIAEQGQLTAEGVVDHIHAEDEAVVDVTGDVNGYVSAYDEASVEVTGDVSLVEAFGEAVVDITGDVIGEDSNESGFYYAAPGVVAMDNATVSVDGDVSGGDGYIPPEAEDDPNASDMGYNGIFATGNAQVTVTGNVSGGDGALSEAAMQESTAFGDGGAGVVAENNAVVTVGGDVTGGNSMGTFGYAGEGVEAYGKANVTVGGDVTGGDVVADPDVEAYTEVYEYDGESSESVSNSIAGTGVCASSTATVSIGGNVTGGSTNGDEGIGGDGLLLYPVYDDPDAEEPAVPGSVTIGGIVSGGAGDAAGDHGKNGVDIAFGGQVGYTQTAVDALLKLGKEALMDEDGITDEFFALSQLLSVSLDAEEWDALVDAFLEENDIDIEEDRTDEEWMELECELLAYMAANVEEVDVVELNKLHGADTFASVTVGGYDEDPTFSSYDNVELLVEAYCEENVAPLMATPATGDSFNVVLVGSICVMAMLAMAAMVVARKKHG